MKLYCVVILLLHACIVSSQEVEEEQSNSWNISLADFHQVVTSGDALVIDVREPDEVSDVRVDAKSYVNVPLKQLGKALKMDERRYKIQYKSQKPEADDAIVFICRSGKRSDFATKIARKENYLNTRHYNKGTNGWVANFPDLVVRSESNPWNISLAEFHALVTTGNTLVIDVREPHEVAEVHVDANNYVNVPLKKLGKALTSEDGFYAEKYDGVKPNFEDPIVFICRSGRRSDTAIRIARELNYFNTRHFNTGTLGWLKNYPDIAVRPNNEMKEEL